VAASTNPGHKRAFGSLDSLEAVTFYIMKSEGNKSEASEQTINTDSAWQMITSYGDFLKGLESREEFFSYWKYPNEMFPFDKEILKTYLEIFSAKARDIGDEKTEAEMTIYYASLMDFLPREEAEKYNNAVAIGLGAINPAMASGPSFRLPGDTTTEVLAEEQDSIPLLGNVLTLIQSYLFALPAYYIPYVVGAHYFSRTIGLTAGFIIWIIAFFRACIMFRIENNKPLYRKEERGKAIVLIIIFIVIAQSFCNWLAGTILH
jgi:hypothetical protein